MTFDASEWDDDVLTAVEEIHEPDAVGSRRLSFAPNRDDTGIRLDKYLANALPDLSRSYLQQLIENGGVQVDGIERRRAFKVTAGEVVDLLVPPLVVDELLPEAIPLSIVFEDEDVLVIDKPAGMVVHPAPGHATGTLVNAVLHHAPQIALAGSNRPGIVHRLDKETSGLIVVAKSDRGRNSLVRQWGERSVEKSYIALAKGEIVDDKATIDVPIGRDPVQRNRMASIMNGRDAISRFQVAERFGGATLINVRIETGRTHQIRVHLAFIGHPVVGDSVYNRSAGRFGGSGAIVDRHFLHAARLAFQLPHGERVAFESPLPGDLAGALLGLREDRDFLV